MIKSHRTTFGCCRWERWNSFLGKTPFPVFIFLCDFVGGFTPPVYKFALSAGVQPRHEYACMCCKQSGCRVVVVSRIRNTLYRITGITMSNFMKVGLL